MNNKKKRRIILCCVAVLLCALIGVIAYENKNLETNCYTIESDRIPHSFDSFKIAQVSDLHNTQIGKDNVKLISQLKATNPDIIVVTGDIIDSLRTNVDVAVSFMEKATKIAPCYYINGNNDLRNPQEYEQLKTELSKLSVTILENDSIKLEQDDEFITVIGVNDPVFYEPILQEEMPDTILKTSKIDDSYTVLLSHRPELFDLYVKYDYDLVFTGHAHGGQFRLPYIGGLFAPHQGKFPKYDSGLFTENNTNMLVSRGVGNSIFPFRFNNRPEIIVAQLKTK